MRYPTRQEENEFFIALGKAITDWAHIEAELFEITAAILNTTQELSAIVFYRTPTLDSRLTLTDDFIKTLFPPKKPGEHTHPTLKLWSVLQSDIKANLNTRNRLAHHQVAPVVDIWVTSDASEHKVIARHASFIGEPERLRKREPFQALGKEEIEAHIQVVSEFIMRLRDFRLNVLPSPLQARAQQLVADTQTPNQETGHSPK